MIARELLVKLGFKIDHNKLDRFEHNIESVKSRIATLQNKVAQTLSPKVNVAELINYKKELSKLSTTERKKVLELNKIEKLKAKEDAKRYKERIRQLRGIQARLRDNNGEFKRAMVAARAANMTFSRYFTRFALVGAGGFLLNIKNTLKEAKEFKVGNLSATGGGFTNAQINSVDNYNDTLTRTKRIMSSLRNEFITGLLPVFGDYLKDLNYWLVTNRKLIQTKLKEFMDKLIVVFKGLGKAASFVYKALDPLAQMIGGWGNVLVGTVGAGILSWVVRLGVFLGGASVAVAVFTRSVFTLTAALLTNPIVLTIAAIVAALALLVDEIYVTIKGGDSLINRFKPLRKAFDLTGIVFEGFLDSLREIGKWFDIIADKVAAFTGGAYDSISSFFNKLPAFKLKTDLDKPDGLDELLFQTKGGLNVFKSNDSSNKIFRNIEPREVTPRSVASSSINNRNNKIVVNNRNNVDVSLSVPEGYTQLQIERFGTIVADKIDEGLRKANLETIHAIGAY